MCSCSRCLYGLNLELFILRLCWQQFKNVLRRKYRNLTDIRIHQQICSAGINPRNQILLIKQNKRDVSFRPALLIGQLRSRLCSKNL